MPLPSSSLGDSYYSSEHLREKNGVTSYNVHHIGASRPKERAPVSVNRVPMRRWTINFAIGLCCQYTICDWHRCCGSPLYQEPFLIANGDFGIASEVECVLQH